MSYTVDQAPHIQADESVPKIYWKFVLSLIPAVILSIFVFRWEAVVIMGSSISAAVLAEIVACRGFKEEVMLRDGSSILTGMLFGLLCFPGMPVWLVALGSFGSIFLGREIFGGVGQNPLNAVLVGHALLGLVFPELMKIIQESAAAQPVTEGMSLLSSWNLARPSPGAMIAEPCAIMLMAGGLFLIWSKLIYWEVPLIYLSVLFLFSHACKIDCMAGLLSGSAYLAAFYVVTDYATIPMTRTGARIFACAGAAFVAISGGWLPQAYRIPFAILTMNALTPWLDLVIRPSGVEKEQNS